MDSVYLPAGGSVTYTSTAPLDPADNTAIDTDIVTPPLFADGFESGTSSAWWVVVP